jgi:hypothetical protein
LLPGYGVAPRRDGSRTQDEICAPSAARCELLIEMAEEWKGD